MKRTSTVFATWHHLYRILDQLNWPPHPTTNEVPPVLFGDAVEIPNECLIVVGVPIDRPRSEWVSVSGPSQDEDYVLQVLVSTRVPGMSREATFLRLEQLVELLEATLRNQSTGVPAGGFTEAVPGVLWHRVAQVAPQLFPLTEGFGAFCEIDIAFHARI